MAWTKVPKPVDTGNPVYTGGDPIGLLLALTYTTITNSGSDWVKVPKPTVESWTKVAEPTT